MYVIIIYLSLREGLRVSEKLLNVENAKGAVRKRTYPISLPEYGQ